MPSQKFYLELPSVSDFETFGDSSKYTSLPDDWYVIVTDVCGSTKAIEHGRFQDVNMLGAASVAVLEKFWQNDQIPFLYGGDGATLFVPEFHFKNVVRSLLRLRNFALKNYGLELRVGAVSMAEIREQGLNVEIAKFQIEQNRPTPFVRGGGVTWADHMIKAVPEKYCLIDDNAGALVELKGLSCTWDQVKPKNGRVLSVMVRSESDDALDDVITMLGAIMSKDLRLSDFRKFDDTLRLVIDCTSEQVRKIRIVFEALHGSGRLLYGLHESDTAVTTCLGRLVEDRPQFKFIDGGSGGYALAAKALKDQLRRQRESIDALIEAHSPNVAGPKAKIA